MSKKTINFRVLANEFDALEIYARRHGRSKTEVVREFLRELERKNERSVSPPVSARARASARPPKSPPTKTKGVARA